MAFIIEVPIPESHFKIIFRGSLFSDLNPKMASECIKLIAFTQGSPHPGIISHPGCQDVNHLPDRSKALRIQGSDSYSNSAAAFHSLRQHQR